MTTAGRPLDVIGSSSGIKTASTWKPTEPQPPPFLDRRRLNRICSLATLVFIMCQLQQSTPSGGGFGGVSAAPAPAPASPLESLPTPESLDPMDSTLVPLKHLQKRDTSFRLRFQREMNASSSHLDWENTCGGVWTGEVEKRSRTKRCKKRQMILQRLQNQTARELGGVQTEDKARTTTDPDQLATATNKALNIMKKRKWKLHNINYKFLPRLNSSSQQLNLRHVHRDLQFYVGAFTYLRHAKMHWDYNNLQAESVLSAELERMRHSARQVLCSVEGAINQTNLLYAPTARQSQARARHQRQKKRGAAPLVTFKVIPLKLMEKRLQQFRTPVVELNHQATLAAQGQEVAPPPLASQLKLDALFLKIEFVQYLKSIRKILNRQRKDLCTEKKRIQVKNPNKIKS
ncbi:uncharacterized protein LOC108088566 [Drosophila ficusphila]|uniref:uncharacterized protein LOC108088566 n=1 Tax=Drosophila ficusphila TaxID=30025 RepID=UPI0007E728E6|nr:uncharacterized protein LOC108088566 [Drosophila ficusphila]